MDTTRYLLRPFRDGDHEATARLRTLWTPEFPTTAEEERHWEESFVAPHLVNEVWLVEDRTSREVVGMGGISHSPFNYDARKFWVTCYVEPARRRQGIGRALMALLESELAAHRAVAAWTSVRGDDPATLDFVRRWGAVERRRLWVNELEVPPTPEGTPSDRRKELEAGGLRFTTLAIEGPERPEVRARLFDLHEVTARDVPRMGEYTPVTFEQFIGALLGGPLIIPEAYFLARSGEEYVAMTNLERELSNPSVLRVGFTGTRPAYRGRGIASELKQMALEYARAKGVRRLRTVNDSLNRPILAINERLGFHRTVEWVQGEREFPPRETSPTSAPSR